MLRADTLLFIPLPSVDQVLPSHWTMRLALLAPAVVKLPPAIRSPLYTVRADTLSTSLPLNPLPSPSPDQVLPFHWAMLYLALPPPAVRKSPPANRLPL